MEETDIEANDITPTDTISHLHSLTSKAKLVAERLLSVPALIEQVLQE